MEGVFVLLIQLLRVKNLHVWWMKLSEGDVVLQNRIIIKQILTLFLLLGRKLKIFMAHGSAEIVHLRGRIGFVVSESKLGLVVAVVLGGECLDALVAEEPILLQIEVVPYKVVVDVHVHGDV